MVHHPEVIPTISQEGVLKEFESPILQKIAKALEDLYQRKGRLDLPEALASFEETLKGEVVRVCLSGKWAGGGRSGKDLAGLYAKDSWKEVKKRKGRVAQADQRGRKTARGKKPRPSFEGTPGAGEEGEKSSKG